MLEGESACLARSWLAESQAKEREGSLPLVTMFSGSAPGALVMDAAALQSFMDEHFPQAMGELVLDTVDEHTVRLRLRPGERHLRPGDTISGPSMFLLADVAIFLAILSKHGPSVLTVTTNANIDFMRKPAAGRDLVATARVLKLGRVLAVGDALLVSDGEAAPVARASMTYSIPPRSPTDG